MKQKDAEANQTKKSGGISLKGDDAAKKETFFGATIGNIIFDIVYFRVLQVLNTKLFEQKDHLKNVA
jgi:hypothetical protein